MRDADLNSGSMHLERIEKSLAPDYEATGSLTF
jgi:hypothetical protein